MIVHVYETDMTLFYWSPMITAFQLSSSMRIRFQLMGEWIMWQSTIPSYEFNNKVTVDLSFPSEVSILQQESFGPFVFQKKRMGHYELDNYECLSEADFLKNVPSFSPICSTPLTIIIKSDEIRLMSFCGIGLNEVPIQWNFHLNKIIPMNLHIVGREDMFLWNNDLKYCHLIRQTKPSEPFINVPLTTFIATHVCGMILGRIFDVFFYKYLVSIIHI